MEITGKGATARKAQIGVSTGNTNVCFEKADQQSPLNLTGKAKTYVTVQRFKISTSIFFNFWRTSVLFVGPLMPLFWTSSDVCPGFQSQGGFPHLQASLPACNGFLRFTSGVGGWSLCTFKNHLSLLRWKVSSCHRNSPLK